MKGSVTKYTIKGSSRPRWRRRIDAGKDEKGHRLQPRLGGFKKESDANNEMRKHMDRISAAQSEDSRLVRQFGFATKQAAINAEAYRRIAEQEKDEQANTSCFVAPLPKTLAALLDEFFRQHVDKKL